MGIHITTEPVDVTINGVTFNLQGDPTNTPQWRALLETKVAYGSDQQKSHEKLVEALVGLAETPEDAEIIRGLTAGTRTLQVASEQYVKAVTGFPTQPSKPSTKR